MAANVITRNDWIELVEPGLYEVFDTAYDAEVNESMIPEIFSVEDSDKAFEHLLEAGDLDNLEVWSGSIPYSQVTQGYKKTLTHVARTRGVSFDIELVEDDLYGVIESIPKKLGMVAARTKEVSGADYFNNADSTVNTVGDGLALLSSAHTSNNGGSTQSNRGTTALSPITVEANRRAMALFKSNRDNLLNFQATHLLVPIQLQETAFEIVYSKGKVDNANNNANFLYQQLQIIPWKYLTDTTNWFTLDLKMAKMYLKWFNRIQTYFFRDSEFDSLQKKYAVRCRYSLGANEWRWVYGNAV